MEKEDELQLEMKFYPNFRFHGHGNKRWAAEVKYVFSCIEGYSARRVSCLKLTYQVNLSDASNVGLNQVPTRRHQPQNFTMLEHKTRSELNYIRTSGQKCTIDPSSSIDISIERSVLSLVLFFFSVFFFRASLNENLPIMHMTWAVSLVEASGMKRNGACLVRVSTDEMARRAPTAPLNSRKPDHSADYWSLNLSKLFFPCSAELRNATNRTARLVYDLGDKKCLGDGKYLSRRSKLPAFEFKLSGGLICGCKFSSWSKD